MKNQPVYSIDSVDHALHLAAVLQQEGSLRVFEAAERLGVARSTAHRLLAMLVYRDFAEQGPDRRYLAGPAGLGIGSLYRPGQTPLRLVWGGMGDLKQIAWGNRVSRGMIYNNIFIA